MKSLFQFFSYFPLSVLHGLGAVLGLLVWGVSGVYRRRLAQNATQAGYGLGVQLAAAAQAGKMVAELPRLWLGRPVPVYWNDLQGFESEFMPNQGVIILTPHLGSWEIVGQAVASASNDHGRNMTVMYRPARQPWLDAIVSASRQRPGMKTVPADLSGVRQSLRALKNEGVVGLLPDQVPPEGMGVWAKVFDKPAYTMTLAAKLTQTARCPVVMVWCERLSWGRGYRIFTQTLALDLNAPLEGLVQAINDAVDATIQRLPNQYLWGYARYKAPRGSSQGVSTKDSQ